MRILAVKDDGVTLGVIGKDAQLIADLREVTFEDDAGTPHTVYAHKDGPFTTPEAIVEAWRERTLHVQPEEQEQSEQAAPPAGEVFS